MASQDFIAGVQRILAETRYEGLSGTEAASRIVTIIASNTDSLNEALRLAETTVVEQMGQLTPSLSNLIKTEIPEGIIQTWCDGGWTKGR
jgi:hypothetical protein